jgi:hypothetical protein
VATTPDELVAATRQAIADATAYDKWDINRNFAHDDQAYSEVKRNQGRLIGSGQLPQAMSLAVELMKRGSYQVEMSNEGLMTEDIEDRLSVVLGALRKCDLPAAEVIAWCAAMLENDRVGFIAREPLEALRNHPRGPRLDCRAAGYRPTGRAAPFRSCRPPPSAAENPSIVAGQPPSPAPEGSLFTCPPEGHLRVNHRLAVLDRPDN